MVNFTPLHEIIDKYIDEIVKTIDYDIWKEGYSRTSPYYSDDQEETENDRNEIEMILYRFIDEIK